MAVDIDSIQLKLASKCRFQIVAFICLGMIYASCSWNTFGVIFLAADVGQSCDDDSTNGASSSSTSQVARRPNTSSSAYFTSEEKNSGIGAVFSTIECDVHAANYNNVTNSTTHCPHGWIYLSDYKSQKVSEWNLVCVRAYLSEFSMIIYFIGSMAGAMVISPFSDKYGRRPILLICLLIQAACGSTVAWAPNYELFSCLRFLVGFFNMGIALCTFTMVTEIFPARYRTIPCLGFQIFWGVGIMITALLGYAIQNWHHLQLAIALPNVVCMVFVWFLPESLPWLIFKNKRARAQVVVETISRFNGINVPNDLLVYENVPAPNDKIADETAVIEGTSTTDGYAVDQSLLSGAEEPAEEMHLLALKSCVENGVANEVEAVGPCQSPASSNADRRREVLARRINSVESEDRRKLRNVCSLCPGSRTRLYFGILIYLFFVNSLSYFGISLSIPVLHNDGYINLFLLGAVEIPAYIFCVVVCARIGRKIPLLMFMLICGFMNIVAMLISKQASSGMSVTRVVMVMAGKAAITGAYSTVYLHACEIFPTAIRNQALGAASVFENLGSIAAPYIIYFARSHQELPMVLFGLLSVVGGVTVFALPETQGLPLPKTLSDVEALGMQKRRRIE